MQLKYIKKRLRSKLAVGKLTKNDLTSRVFIRINYIVNGMNNLKCQDLSRYHKYSTINEGSFLGG